MGFQLPADDPGAARGVVPDHSVAVLASRFFEDRAVCYRGRCLCGYDSGDRDTKAGAEGLGVVHLREMRTKREAS